MSKGELKMNARKNVMAWLWSGILSIILFFTAIWGVEGFNQFLLYDDEFGYWAASAYLTKTDWISVTSGIPYYSYGYGFLVLTPIRLLFSDTTAMYQALIIANGLMLVGSFWIARNVAKQLFADAQPFLRDILCFAVMMYPQNLLSAHIGWTECILVFAFWIFVWLSLRVVCKPSLPAYIGTAVMTVVLYTIHHRTLAVMIATVMVMLWLFVSEAARRRDVAIFTVVWSFLMAGHVWVKADLLETYYHNTTSAKKAYIFLAIGIAAIVWLVIRNWKYRKFVYGLGALLVVAGGIYFVVQKNAGAQGDVQVNARVAINDFAGQVDKFKAILTLDGFKLLLESILGKWLYLAIATMFTIWWSVEVLLRDAWCYVCAKWRKAKSADELSLWRIWMLLAIVGNFMIAAIYMLTPIRNDVILYGRYNEYMLGIYVIIGVFALAKDKNWIPKLIGYAVFCLIAGYISQQAADRLSRTSYQAYHSIASSIFLKKGEYASDKVMAFAAWGMGVACVCVAALRLRMNEVIRWIRAIVLTVALSGLSIYIAYTMVNETALEKQSLRIYNITSLTDAMKQLKRNDDMPVYYFTDTESRYWAESFQFLIQETPLQVVQSWEVVPEGDQLIFTGDDFVDRPEFSEKYYCVKRSNQFALIVPKGGELEEKAHRLQGE